ncbi:MAG: hypothetical protein IJA45_08245, partial [Oscillospiraceae bacterium]|nr:hypothetical protein [Oscillospiraceae bacterium]
KSSAVIGGSFAPTFQFIKLEIHTVFLRFLNFNLRQNLSPLTLVDLISGYSRGGLGRAYKNPTPERSGVGYKVFHGSTLVAACAATH